MTVLGTLVSIHSNLALCYLRQGRAGPALDSADRALALEPGHAKARFRRCRALVALGRADEAQAELERMPRGPGRDEIAVAIREAGRGQRTVCARMLRGLG
jgi:predicted Zn-dependent protease